MSGLIFCISELLLKIRNKEIYILIVSSVQIIMFRNREIFRYTERMKESMNLDKIFERATIRGIADYLLFGVGPDEDDRSYEERLDEPYIRFEKAVRKYDKSPTSELLDLCNEVSSETASVYMEIGLQAGILLMVDMMKIMVGKKNLLHDK